MLFSKGLIVLSLILVIYQSEAYPKRENGKRSSSKSLKEEEKEIEFLLREINKFRQLDKKDVKLASESNDDGDTDEEIIPDEPEEKEESIDNTGNQNVKRGLGDLNKLSGGGHGGAMLSQSQLPPDSGLTNLVESFHAVAGGEVLHAKNINPKLKSKSIGDSLDHHKMTHQQMVEAGLISETIGGSNGRKRNFIQSNSQLWTMKTIPYEIRTSDFTQSQIDIIKLGFNEFHTKTCLRWEPRSDAVAQTVGHNSYIEFFSESGCWSYVGRVFSGRQQISLQAPGCVSVSTAVHEMCHAIGQQHEQSRADRDNYVDMYWNNIQGGTGNINMAKSNTRDNNPYDAESVLQYSLYAFSTNGQKVMDFKDRNLNFLADTAKGLEFYDVQDVTDAYGCADHCQNPPSCQNGGFLNFQCVCVCPDGLTGSTCEQIADSCGSIINLGVGQTQEIKTPNYPSPYPGSTKCTWLLKAPSNALYPEIEVIDMDLPQQNGLCFHWLEVQYNLLGQTGPRLCGTIQGEKYISSLDSGNMMLLRFDSAFSADRTPTKGFSLRAKASGGGCRGNNCVYGTCVDNINDGSYTCQCQTGYSGQFCDQPNAQATLSCTFDDTACFMGDVTTDQFDWTINTGSTPSSSTGPSAAHGGSKYLYAETSSPRVQGDKAIYESKLNLPNVHRCLIFWYHAYGGNVGTLNVNAISSSGNPVNLFTKSGDSGNQWIEAKVDVPAQNGLKIQFEAIRGPSWNGDIAIDDVVLRPGSCQAPTQPPTTQAPTQPPTTQAPTQPPTTQAPTQPPTTQAPTQPPTTQPPTQPPTTQTPTQPPTTQPPTQPPTTQPPTQPPTTQPPTQPPTTQPPTQPPTTQPPTQPPTTQPPTQPPSTTWNPPITSTSGPSLSLNCNFESGNQCWLTNSQNDQFDWTIRSGRTPSSSTGPSSAYEGNKYSYIETSSPRRNGDMAILESSYPLTAGDYCMEFAYHMYGSSIGELWINETQEMGMAWHLSGNQGNKWHKTAVQLYSWTQLKVQIVAVRGSSFRGDIAIDDITIESGDCGCKSNPCANGGTCMETVAAGYTCVCAAGFTGWDCEAIGDISSHVCSFEDNEPDCFFQDADTIDDFDWSRQTGKTPSSSTGPNSAADGSFYKFIETSSPRKSGDIAILQTSAIDFTLGERCLQFKYHMYGSNIGSLVVNMEEFTMQTLELWRRDGEQGMSWIETAVEVPASSMDYQLQIVGERGSSYRGDIALDSISLKLGKCLCASNPCQGASVCVEDATISAGYRCECAPGYSGQACNIIGNVAVECTFENPVCIFKNDKTQDKFDWTMFHSGTTPSSNTGPSSAAVGGQYAFIEASSPRKNNDNAIMSTYEANFETLDRCLQFQYHMYGLPNSLNVYAYSRNDVQNLVWSRKGNQGNSWKYAQVDIPSTLSDLVIDIEGVRGTSYKGDIAVDEIKIVPGSCQKNTTGLTLHTPDKYNYVSLSNIGITARTRTSLIFTVKACNDAHIGLFNDYPNMTQKQFYEIVIGGWGNTRSVIRKVKQGWAKARYNQRNLLSCTIAKSFWVSWNNGHIKVGTGNTIDSNIFMKWADGNPYMVNYAAVSSGFGSDADWTFS